MEVSRTSYSNGRFSWLVTYRSLIGDPENLGVGVSLLLGSDASAKVEEIVAGNADTLTGSDPRLAAMEKEPGNPDYTAQYVVDKPGQYDVKVMQLFEGGLSVKLFDNQWFYGQPSIERIDPLWSTSTGQWAC